MSIVDIYYSVILINNNKRSLLKKTSKEFNDYTLLDRKNKQNLKYFDC